jgi:hypothetical protein
MIPDSWKDAAGWPAADGFILRLTGRAENKAESVQAVSAD